MRSSYHRGWLAVLFSVSVLFALAKCANAQSVGTITELVGTATVTRGAQTTNVAAAMPVVLQDQLNTQPRSRLTVTLSDNSTLAMGPSSMLVINQHLLGPAGRASTRVSLLGGTVQSAVTSALRGAAPDFEVRTPNAIAGARGTVFTTGFTTQSRPEYPGCAQFTDLSVAQGTVDFAGALNPGAPHVLVSAGFETTIACNGNPLPAGPAGVTGAFSSGSLSPALVAPTVQCPVCPSCPPTVVIVR